jgi:hypothetical protein
MLVSGVPVVIVAVVTVHGQTRVWQSVDQHQRSKNRSKMELLRKFGRRTETLQPQPKRLCGEPAVDTISLMVAQRQV